MWCEGLSGGGCDRDHKWPLEMGWSTGNCREYKYWLLSGAISRLVSLNDPCDIREAVTEGIWSTLPNRFIDLSFDHHRQ